MITDLSVHMKEKIREKNVIAVTQSCRFHINIQDSMAWNSLFKCINPFTTTHFKTDSAQDPSHFGPLSEI